jgi:hypothetical protein
MWCESYALRATTCHVMTTVSATPNGPATLTCCSGTVWYQTLSSLLSLPMIWLTASSICRSWLMSVVVHQRKFGMGLLCFSLLLVGMDQLDLSSVLAHAIRLTASSICRKGWTWSVVVHLCKSGMGLCL